MYVRGSVFKIVELDVWTYNYMNENKNMFTQDAINGAKNYLESKGFLHSPQIKENISIKTSKTEFNNTTNQSNLLKQISN